MREEHLRWARKSCGGVGRRLGQLFAALFKFGRSQRDEGSSPRVRVLYLPAPSEYRSYSGDRRVSECRDESLPEIKCAKRVLNTRARERSDTHTHTLSLGENKRPSFSRFVDLRVDILTAPRRCATGWGSAVHRVIPNRMKAKIGGTGRSGRSAVPDAVLAVRAGAPAAPARTASGTAPASAY